MGNRVHFRRIEIEKIDKTKEELRSVCVSCAKHLIDIILRHVSRTPRHYHVEYRRKSRARDEYVALDPDSLLQRLPHDFLAVRIRLYALSMSTLGSPEGRETPPADRGASAVGISDHLPRDSCRLTAVGGKHHQTFREEESAEDEDPEGDDLIVKAKLGKEMFEDLSSASNLINTFSYFDFERSSDSGGGSHLGPGAQNEYPPPRKRRKGDPAKIIGFRPSRVCGASRLGWLQIDPGGVTIEKERMFLSLGNSWLIIEEVRPKDDGLVEIRFKIPAQWQVGSEEAHFDLAIRNDDGFEFCRSDEKFVFAGGLLGGDPIRGNSNESGQPSPRQSEGLSASLPKTPSSGRGTQLAFCLTNPNVRCLFNAYRNDGLCYWPFVLNVFGTGSYINRWGELVWESLAPAMIDRSVVWRMFFKSNTGAHTMLYPTLFASPVRGPQNDPVCFGCRPVLPKGEDFTVSIVVTFPEDGCDGVVIQAGTWTTRYHY